MFSLIETYMIQVISNKRRGIFPSLIKGILWVFSWIYQLFMYLRNWGFDQGLFRQYDPPIPMVISIGNIVAGGTGKTPVLLKMAQEFSEQFHTAVLSRGYRSRAEHLASPIILSHGDGHGPIHPPRMCGDEPYMLAKNLLDTVVIVGKDRRKSSILASKAGIQLAFLDDGMQHRRLERDFDVVVVDATNPFGYGYFLPRGFLRESLNSLARVSLIVINHVYSDEVYDRVKKQLERYTKAPTVGMCAKVSGVWSLLDHSPVDLTGKKVGVFCAIAHPQYFVDTVRKAGAEVIGTKFERDHLDFSTQQLNKFATVCKNLGADYLVCTEKDQVKIIEPMQVELPIAWIQIQLEIVKDEYEWNSFILNAKKELANHV